MLSFRQVKWIWKDIICAWGNILVHKIIPNWSVLVKEIKLSNIIFYQWRQIYTYAEATQIQTLSSPSRLAERKEGSSACG